MNMITKSIDEPEKIDYEKWAVEKIQYIKPEAVNKKEPIEDLKGLTITVNETTYDYKFTYFYGWSNNYYQQDSKYRTAFSYILNVLISFTPIKNVTCQWLIGEVAGTYYNLIDETKPATAKTCNKYYYRNKVCSIKPVGATTWYPTCQIGERRTFA